MPIDYSDYPKDWDAIGAKIRDRANECCEWCGVKNGAIGYRDKKGEFHEVAVELLDVFALDDIKTIKIVLTIAHLGIIKEDGSPGDKYDKMDVRTENLAALCQRCHLRFDLNDHIRHAAETRHCKKIRAGQLELP